MSAMSSDRADIRAPSRPPAPLVRIESPAPRAVATCPPSSVRSTLPDIEIASAIVGCQARRHVETKSSLLRACAHAAEPTAARAANQPSPLLKTAVRPLPPASGAGRRMPRSRRAGRGSPLRLRLAANVIAHGSNGEVAAVGNGVMQKFRWFLRDRRHRNFRNRSRKTRKFCESLSFDFFLFEVSRNNQAIRISIWSRAVLHRLG